MKSMELKRRDMKREVEKCTLKLRRWSCRGTGKIAYRRAQDLMESLQDLLAEQQVDPLVVSSLMLLG